MLKRNNCKGILLLLFMFIAATAGAQEVLRVRVILDEGIPLPGASVHVEGDRRVFIADTTGTATITGLKPGTYSLRITHAGLQEQEMDVIFPGEITVMMEAGEEEEEETIIVRATRTSRSIYDEPTRVEIISGEELAEKANMKPGEIRMLLNESTGIQTQQTSATSYNYSIRIQGLDGRYTQILRDGYPLYAGFSGGLSLMQIAPLDLKQVEVIKGAASTLYGGGAIAGLVNLVSKTPTEEGELSFLANATTAGGLDLSSFYSKRFSKTGVTIFGSRNSTKAYDPADIGFTAIPRMERYTIQPRLFYYAGNTTVDVGGSFITEDRTGGSMAYIKNGAAEYFERNESRRLTGQLGITHIIDEKKQLQFKSSYSRFNRKITIPAYSFEGLQRSFFSELTYATGRSLNEWIVGLNLVTDAFEEANHSLAPRDYSYATPGAFIQNTVSLSPRLLVETGLRADYVEQFGWEILPRFSFLYRASSKFSMRLGGGKGYKTPTIFTEEAERQQFNRIHPIDEANTKNERSRGGNFDINYRAQLGSIGVSINQLFFYTKLENPLLLSGTPGDQRFVNADGHIDTKGLETNLRFLYGDFKLFVGYTYADVQTHFNGVKGAYPLTARHRLNNVLMYEKEDVIKVGLEGYYIGKQELTDGSTGKPYWIFGFMVEKPWEKFSLFINFENFTDTRQTKFGPIYTGTMEAPVFKDIYAPLDGFVANGGLRIQL